MKQTLKFLKELAENNNREWFNDNRDRYLTVKESCETFTARLIAAISEFVPATARMTPQECMYRIYRDIRFSNDKTPYKDHIGIFINPIGGKKGMPGGYYLHIQPGNCLLGGGVWCPTPPVLKALRQSIYDNIDEYLEIIENPEFRQIYPIVGEDLLKTVPKGFPKDWEHIDLLKPRSYTAMCPLKESDVTGSKAISQIAEKFRILKPFNDFLNYTFEENPLLPRTF